MKRGFFLVYLGMIGIVGCSKEEESATPEIEYEAGRTDLCAEAFLPTGFGLGWENLNHRISVWSVAFDPSRAVACDGETGVDLSAYFIGGDFTTGEYGKDIPFVRSSYAVVGPRDLAEDEAVDPALEVVFGEATSSIDTSQSANLTLPSLAFSDESAFPTSVVAIAGIELRTDVEQTSPDYPDDYEPDLGYTSKGMAFSIEDKDDPDATLSFFLGPADRTDMNEAIQYAITEGTARYMRIGLKEGAITRADWSIHHEYPTPEAFDSTPLESLSDEETRVTISGQSGFEHAAVVMTSYRYDLFPDEDYGDYIRELTTLIENVEHDSDSGEVTFNANVYLSNAGALIQGPMVFDASFSFALLQWNGGSDVTHMTFMDSFTVDAAATFALPLEMIPKE